MRPFKTSLGLFLCALIMPCASLAEEQAYQDIKAKVEAIQQDAEITSISATPVTGILEVEINDSKIIYSSSDGSYIFTGSLLDISSGVSRNLTDERIQDIRSKILEDLPPNTLITFNSSIDEVAEVYVFTDVSCGYCKNFHKHIDEFNSAGITVHYAAFPRSGEASEAGRLMRKVWCASSPKEALTEAKATGKMEQAVVPCQSPMTHHIEVALKLGVNGTPFVLSKDGRVLGGYITPQDLLKAVQ